MTSRSYLAWIDSAYIPTPKQGYCGEEVRAAEKLRKKAGGFRAKNGRYARRTEPRAAVAHPRRKLLVEEAQRPLSIRALLDIKVKEARPGSNGLFPSQRDQGAYNEYDGRHWPYIEHLWVSNRDIKVRFVDGGTQIVDVDLGFTGEEIGGGIWHRRRRLVCPRCEKAKRRHEELYFRAELGPLLACVRCQKMTFASRQCDRHHRPGLQLVRKKAEREHGRMWRKGKRSRKLDADIKELSRRDRGVSKRFSDVRFQVPLKWNR